MENQIAAILIKMSQELKNVKRNKASGKFNGNAIHAFLQNVRKSLIEVGETKENANTLVREIFMAAK